MRGPASLSDPFATSRDDDLASAAVRRSRFLAALNWGWLGMGILALLSLPFHPEQRALLIAIMAATLSTFLAVRFLVGRGRARVAAALFTALVDLGLFAIFLLLAEEVGTRQALITETPALMMMGLAVLFAGALVDPRAPFAVALLNSILLSLLVFRSESPDPRFSVHVFWWLLALVAWLYERALGNAFGRLEAARQNLQGLVEQRTAELQESVRNLSRAMDALETTNQELDAFASAVSHDLRAPVRSVIGFSDALEEEHAASLNEEGREHLSRVQRAGRRMNALIDDLLRLSRVTRPELQWEDLDLSTVARTAFDDLQRAEPDRSVRYESPDRLHARGDPRLVQVLLENLLGNAWKFTRGKEEARVEVGETDLHGERVFFVRDNGVGFDMSYADKLFRPFQRLHSASEFDGTGIGLATAQRIVRRHGGRIWAEAGEGAGASFFFTLASSRSAPRSPGNVGAR